MTERLGRNALSGAGAPIRSIRRCTRGLTFTWFAFTLFWFWSNWQQIGEFIHALGPAALVLVWAAIFVAATVILAAMEAARGGILRVTLNQAPVVRSRYLRTAWDTALVVVIAAMTFLLELAGARHRLQNFLTQLSMSLVSGPAAVLNGYPIAIC